MRRQLLCIVFLCIMFAACGGGNPNTTSSTKSQPPAATPTPTPKPAPKTAEQFAQALKDAGMPIGNITIITKANDPSKLFGEPGQYTSRVDFEDTRIDADQIPANVKSVVAPGGSIEVFEHAENANARIELIKTIAGMLAPEHDYLKGAVILRISGQLTEAQAKEYEAKFEGL